MTRTLHPRLAAYLGTGITAALAGVALGRPWLVAAGAPFLAVVLVGLLRDRAPELEVVIEASPARIVEGDTLDVSVTVTSPRTTRLAVDVPLPGARGTIVARVLAGQPRTLTWRTRVDRWGGYAIGPVRIETAAACRLVSYRGALGTPAAIRVHPRPERLRRGLVPRATRPWPGALPSRAAGDGLELADVRLFHAGDPARRVNRRMTARTGRLYVTERRPERTADVILLLDTFAAVPGTLEQAVRAADAIAAFHIARGDRVGIVAFGGVLHWLAPGGGARTRMRIAEALIETEIVFSYAVKDVRLLPRRMLPPRALVLALTPLLDERGIGAVLDLRARGVDVTAITITPLEFAAPADRRAARLWRLMHEAQRSRLARAGIPVAAWPRGAPLEQPVEELARWRRAA